MKEQRYRIASLWLLLLVMMQAAAQQPAAIMADSDSLFVCISHCMRRESLPGLTEVGLQLVRTNQ